MSFNYSFLNTTDQAVEELCRIVDYLHFKARSLRKHDDQRGPVYDGHLADFFMATRQLRDAEDQYDRLDIEQALLSAGLEA
jgi:hypothetical protein